MKDLSSIVAKFNTQGTITEIKPLGAGLINDTYKVNTQEADAPDYVLQRINHAIFQNVEMLQSNIAAVTGHIRKKLTEAGEADIDRKVLSFLATEEGKTYWFDGESYWRVMVFIPRAKTYETVNPEYSNYAGEAFGNFQAMLADIPETLGETIPDFHNMEFRLKQLRDAVAANAAGRVAEVQYYLDEIEKRAELGISYEEMAVLFRIHTDARPVAEEFLERKIPFQMKERLPNLYDHFIAKDICAYFRLALGNIERNDLLQVMNRPKRYIGRDSVASGKPSLKNEKFYCDKEWMLDRIDQFEWDVKMLRKTAPYAGINYIRKRIGYDDFLKDYAFTRKIDRANLNEVLAELEEAARPFATIEEWFRHIEEYTRLLRLKSMKRQEDREGVRLMTLHSAKGLEFDTVFLVEANEGKMPYKKAKTDAETEEERRLFYVGMTRAKEVLKVSYVKTKNGKETSPSRFVDELLE